MSKSPVIFAQAMGEYGVVSGLVQAGEEAAYSIGEWVQTRGSLTWMVMTLTALVILRFLLRRRGV